MAFVGEEVSVEAVGEIGCALAPSSTNPLLSVGTTMFRFGIRTTPRL